MNYPLEGIWQCLQTFFFSHLGLLVSSKYKARMLAKNFKNAKVEKPWLKS